MAHVNSAHGGHAAEIDQVNDTGQGASSMVAHWTHREANEIATASPPSSKRGGKLLDNEVWCQEGVGSF